MRTLYLEQKIDTAREGQKRYIVTKAVNTVKYTVGESLQAASVATLCNDAGYKIIIS